MNTETHIPSTRTRYATDLTDAEWAILTPLVPAPKRGGRLARWERREIMNAILYALGAGQSWRLLPHDLPGLRVFSALAR